MTSRLESLGKILAAGFGDRVLTGIITGALNGVTPHRCYEYIQNDMQLLNQVSDSDLNKYRRLVKSANVGNITIEDIMRELGKHHLDILGVIINHPKGEEWLDRQVIELKKKLELV